MSDERKIPTWGYKDGEGKIFQLSPGESLPAGWADSPAPMAQAVSEPGPEVSEPEADALDEGIQQDLGTAPKADPDLDIPHPGAPKEEAPEAEAEAELVEIPEDWAVTGTGSHFRRIKLAKLIDPNAEITNDAEAIAVIEAELARRG